MTTQPAEIPELSEALAAKLMLDMLVCGTATIRSSYSGPLGKAFCIGLNRFPFNCKYTDIVMAIGLDRCRELIADSSRKGEANGV